VEPTRTKEKRQAQEHVEKRSGAAAEGGTSHMGHSEDNSSLAADAPLQEQQRHTSSKSLPITK